MPLRGVLFDLDDTLADTAAAERASWPALAAVIVEHLPSVDPAALELRYLAAFQAHWAAFVRGDTDFASYRLNRLREALVPWGEPDDELFAAYRIEKRRAVERLEPFEDAVATLRRLRALGLRIGLLSNGPSRLQRQKLATTELWQELDAVAISEELGVAKPDPAAFRSAAALLRLPPGEVAMVGDSPAYDVAGALASSMGAAVWVQRAAQGTIDGAIAVRALREVPGALGL